MSEQRRYDPLRDPDPQHWLDLDEAESIDLVQSYHRRRRIRLPNPRIHAAIHVIVENQLALGEPIQVRPTLARLQAEGLDRHDALHAIGLVLARYVVDLVKEDGKGARASTDAVSEAYGSELERLTADGWRRSG